jgi:uncharacterized protein (DUF2062 family)
MRHFFRKHLPDHDSIRNQRWLGPLRQWLHHPNLWHLHRRSVAGGVAAGLFCGLVPGPLQMLSAALLAIVFRVNLPVAVVATLYTNPFTIVPLYLLAYEIGKQVTGAQNGTPMPDFPEVHWQDWFSELWQWLLSLGEPLLWGLPLLATGLALTGYLAVRLLWRAAVVWKWRHRRRKYRGTFLK